MGLQRKRFLIFPLGIGLWFCFAEGFVPRSRPNQPSLSLHQPILPGHPFSHLAQAIPSTEDDDVPSIGIGTRGSAVAIVANNPKITEMASVLCTMLLKEVATTTTTVLMEDDDNDNNEDDEEDSWDGIQTDLAAMERLLKVLQMMNKNNNNDSLEKMDSINEETVTTTESRNTTVADVQEENNLRSTSALVEEEPSKSMVASGSSTVTKNSMDSIDIDIDIDIDVAADDNEPREANTKPVQGSDTDTDTDTDTEAVRPRLSKGKASGADGDDDVLPKTTEEFQSPQSSWAPTPVPLEVVESDVLPLRPSSIPRKSDGIVEPQALDQSEDGSMSPPESQRASSKEEQSTAPAWDQTLPSTTYEANEVKDLDSILTRAGAVTDEDKAKELFQRKLLQKRLELVEAASRTQQEAPNQITKTASAGNKDRADSVISSKQQQQQQQQQAETKKSEELFHRSLLRGRLDIDARSGQLRTKRAEQMFQRKLLQSKLKYDARSEAEKSSISKETSNNTEEKVSIVKKSEDLFHRKLLRAKLDIDARSQQLRRKTVEQIFQRKLLQTKLEYDARSEAEKILMSKKALSKAALEATKKTSEFFQRKLLAERLRQDKREREAKQLFHKRVTKEIPELESKGTVFEPGTAPEVVTSENGAEWMASIPIVEDEIRNPEIEGDGDDASNNGIRDWVSSLPTVARERYAREAKLSHSFVPTKYNPTWWSQNNHFQTIVGTLFRKETMYSQGFHDIQVLLDLAGIGKQNNEERNIHPLDLFRWDERVRMDTEDGDFFLVDWKYADDVPGHKNDAHNNEKPICLICHGLESCSDSELAKEFAMACNDQNMDAACLNFRGCCDYGEECNLTERAYHLGFTDDLMHQIKAIHSETPNRRIYLSGFSLGAGVVTKLLAELGDNAHRYNVCGAAVNAVPFDTSQCYHNMNEPGITKTIYGDRLLKSMKTRMKKQYDMGVFPFERSEIDDCQTIMDVENLIIAPAFNFDDALDYYDKVKTIDKLHNVCVPELVIQARDDPFFAGLECPENDPNRPLRILYTEKGGHCGYIAHQSSDANAPMPKVSWMPLELARFLAHLEKTHSANDRDQPLVARMERSEVTTEPIPAGLVLAE